MPDDIIGEDEEIVEQLFPEDVPEELEPKRRVTAKGAAIVSARVVAGLVGIGCGRSPRSARRPSCRCRR